MASFEPTDPKTIEEAERVAGELLRDLEIDARRDKSRDAKLFEPVPLVLKPLEDRSSCANVDEFVVSRVDLDFEVDLKKRSIAGSARLAVKRAPGASQLKDELVLDAHEAMTIARVQCFGDDLKWNRENYCGFGDELRIQLPGDFDAGDVVIHYTTSGGDAATWLDEAQAGGKPFLYTMGQACLNRALFPCQDAPKARITWTARVIAPSDFLVVAAAPSTGAPEVLKRNRTRHTFAMPVAVPAYLVAFAVGDLASRDIGPRSRVYAHPKAVDAAAAEFRGVTEKYLVAGETLFGKYSWGRYDILVMPRAFAYGGMENPTLTYLSATLVVGDGSLTDTVAHEIAHSWFGNLVTNASWAEFFLNEGFTMYAQRRICRLVDGKAIADLEGAVGWRLLENEINVAQKGGGLFSRLRVPIAWDVDPDDTYNDVPYEKGYALLCAMRDAVVTSSFIEFDEPNAAAALDPWLRKYVEDHQESSVSTEQMVKHFTDFHPHAALKIDWPTWLDGEGLPPIIPTFPASESLALPAEKMATAVAAGNTDGLETAWSKWPTHQRCYFLDKLCGWESELPAAAMYAVNRACGLSESKNCELTMRWALLILRESLELRDDDVERHLKLSAKQKFVLPVFRALHMVDAGRSRRLLDEMRPGLDVAVRKKCDKVRETEDGGIEFIHPADVRPGAGWAKGLLCQACLGAGCPKC